jgi:hypothetical protein
MLTDGDATQRADTHLATPEFARASSVVLALVRVLLQPCGGERQGTQFCWLYWSKSTSTDATAGTKVQMLTRKKRLAAGTGRGAAALSLLVLLVQKYKYLRSSWHKSTNADAKSG